MNASFLSLDLTAKRKPPRVHLPSRAAIAVLLFTALPSVATAQQNVFSRGDSGTGLWWNDTAANYPWYYQTWNNNQNRPDQPSNSTRNDIFIGHNNNTTMTVNGAFFGLRSLTIQSGASSSRTFNSSDNGGISLTVGFDNDSAATQTFNVPIGVDGGTVTFDSSSTGSTTFASNFYLNANTAAFTGSGNFELSGVAGNSGQAGQITKSGSGTLTFSGSGDNVYTGSTTVSGGTLNLNKDVDTDAILGNVSVGDGAVLLLSASGNVANTSDVTLSGGTIRRAGGVTETFDSLTLEAASTLDFGTGTASSLNFGAYTGGGFKLNVSNFLEGNVLTFKTNLSDDINNTSLFGFDNGFTSNWNGTTFTITAIPEPSTYVAAAGLLFMFLWPVRRRVMKDVKSILGLRPTGRARIEAYRKA